MQRIEVKVFPIPRREQVDFLNQLRIVDIKPIIEYHHKLRPNCRSKSNGTKALLVTNLRNCLIEEFAQSDRKKYEELLGYILYRGKLRPQSNIPYEEFTWANKRKYPIPTQGPWVDFDLRAEQKTGNINSQYTTTGVPSAVPGGLVNAQYMNSPAISGGDRTPIALDKVTFGDSGFIMPIKNITTPVICTPSHGRRHTKTISLKLTSDQVDLLNTTNTADPAKMEHGVYLYMVSYQKAFKDLRDKPGKPIQGEIPASLMARVNGDSVLVPNNTMIYKPIELTSPFRITAEYANKIDIIYTTSIPWIAAVVVAARHTPLTLANQIRGQKLASVDEVRQQFFKGSAEDDDDVISEGALVNLKCPLGLCRIQIPSRSKNCKHSQCFDCETFLQFYQGKQQWRCPVCSIIIMSWHELIIDGYFDDILKRTSETDEQIYIEPDGMWKTKNNMSTPRSSIKRTGCRSVEVSEDDAIDLSDLSSSEQNTASNKRRRTEFVDLTLDSDSEGGENNFDLPPMTQEEIEVINAAEAAEANIDSSGNADTTNAPFVTTTSVTTPIPAPPESSDAMPTPRSTSSTLSDRAVDTHSSAPTSRSILPVTSATAVSTPNTSVSAFLPALSAQTVTNNTARLRNMSPAFRAIAPRRRIDTTTTPVSTPTPRSNGHSSTSISPSLGHRNGRRNTYTDIHRQVRTGIGRRSTGNNSVPPHLIRGISDTHNRTQRSAVARTTAPVPMSAPVSPTSSMNHVLNSPSASSAATVVPMQTLSPPVSNQTPQRSPHRSPIVGMSPTYTTLFLNSQLGGAQPPGNNAAATSQGDSRTKTM